MRIKITGRNIELTEGLKAAVEDKLNKLEKYFTPDTEVNVTLSVEKERQKVEVTIPMKGSYIRSEQVSRLHLHLGKRQPFWRDLSGMVQGDDG